MDFVRRPQPVPAHQSVLTYRKKRNWGKVVLPWLFALPTLLLTLFVVTGPAFGTLILSLTDWDGIAPPRFIGLQNFKTLVTDPIFYAALTNNLK